jgi:hypothetical protein
MKVLQEAIMKRPENNNWIDTALTEALAAEKSKPDFEGWKNTHREAVEMLTSRAARKSFGPTSSQHIRRTIMKNRIIGIAAAAVIITVVAVGMMLWPPGREPSGDSSRELVQIPRELLEMPVEKLLEIHFGKIASTFDSSAVAAAVARALDGLSAREILAIGQKHSEGPRIAACMAPSLPPALSEIVEACDFVVHARVEKVNLDVSDLKAAIIHKQRNQLSIYSGAPVKTTVQLNVLGSYPSPPSNVGERIHFTPVFLSENINLLEDGKEYLIALNHHDGLFWLQKWRRGVYPVDPNGAMAANLRNGPMPIDEVWAFIMDTYDAIHEGALPSGEILDYWLAKLQSDDVTECLTAIEYFNTLPEPVAPQELITDAMERFLSGRITDSEETSNPTDASLRRSCFAVETLELLTEVADEPTVDRMLVLYEQDISSGQGIFHEEMSRYDGTGSLPESIVKMLEFALKHPGPERRERFLSLLSQLLGRAGEEAGRRQECVRWVLEAVGDDLGKTEGADIDQLLMDMLEDPASFDISTFYPFSLVWKAAQARGLAEFGAYLEQFLAQPPMKMSDAWHAEDVICTYVLNTMSREEAIQYLVDLHQQGKIGLEPVMDLMIDLLGPDDKQFVPFLGEAIISDWWKAPILAAEVLPDPCLVPALREALERKEPGRGMLLQALFACGEEEDSIEMALAFIQQFFSEEDETSSKPYYHHFDLGDTVRFLGTTGDESVSSSIEYLTREDVIAPYRETVQPWTANGLQQTAVLALGRLGSEAAVPRLREIYQSQETEISVKTAAALSLYCLGDDQGLPLLEHFITDTERSVPEIESVGYYGNERAPNFFQRPILYLQSPRTDTLLLESFHHRVFPYDEGHTGDDRRYYGYAFARKYKREILPLLVEQLGSKDRETRQNANSLLKGLTGRDFGFRPDRYVLQQTEPIERWRTYVDDYLAQDPQPTE